MTRVAAHTVTVRATTDEVWRKLADVAHWPTWDTGMEWAQLEPFALGSKGRFKPKGGSPLPLEIVALDSKRGYRSEVRVATLRLIFDHDFEPTADGTAVTFAISAEGFGKTIFRLLHGSKMRAGLPVWLQNFKESLEVARSA